MYTSCVSSHYLAAYYITKTGQYEKDILPGGHYNTVAVTSSE